MEKTHAQKSMRIWPLVWTLMAFLIPLLIAFVQYVETTLVNKVDRVETSFSRAVGGLDARSIPVRAEAIRTIARVSFQRTPAEPSLGISGFFSNLATWFRGPESYIVLERGRNLIVDYIRAPRAIQNPLQEEQMSTTLAEVALDWINRERRINPNGTAYEFMLLNAHIPRANLARSNLRTLMMSGSNLASSNLAHADLSDAFLAKAKLNKADLSSARLEGAILTTISAAGAIFRFAKGAKADFLNSNLVNSDFGASQLSAAIFRSADLRNANFTNADLSGADFSNANIEGANFSMANLAGSNFTGANVRAADFSLARNIELSRGLAIDIVENE